MDTFETTKQKLKHLLSQNKIKEAIELLRFLKDSNSEASDNIVLIEAQYYEFIKNQLQGVLSYDSIHIEGNRIRRKILNLVDNIHEYDTIRELKNDKNLVERNKKNTSYFTDPRDGQAYKTIEILGIKWMAENLNFDSGDGCWVYKKKQGSLVWGIGFLKVMGAYIIGPLQ